MAHRSISGKKIEHAITSDDILGKDVIDGSGRLIGVVEKLFIDPETLTVIGIDVDKGIMRKGLTIGKNYIKRVTEHAIFLRIAVAYEMKGMLVFDVNGAKVGTVTGVMLKGSRNIVRAIKVRTGTLRTVRIAREYIGRIGDNIFLTISKKELEEISEQKD